MNATNQVADNMFRAVIGMTALQTGAAVRKCRTCVFYDSVRFDASGWGQCPMRETIISRADLACPEHQPVKEG